MYIHSVYTLTYTIYTVGTMAPTKKRENTNCWLNITIDTDPSTLSIVQRNDLLREHEKCTGIDRLLEGERNRSYTSKFCPGDLTLEVCFICFICVTYLCCFFRIRHYVCIYLCNVTYRIIFVYTV